ncbi:hypothetical protein BJV74DRAFT_474589 [Russula compacta]|nr:hypothetical protein BJV74DRAFT_474589 [Russula compacta]
MARLHVMPTRINISLHCSLDTKVLNSHYRHLNSLFHTPLFSPSPQMGLFHIAASCLRHFLHLLLALLDDEPSQGPLLGRFSPSAMEMVPESSPPSLPPSCTSPRFNVTPNRDAPPPKLDPQYVCREHTPNVRALPNGQLPKQELHMLRLGGRKTGVLEEEPHPIEPSLSFALCQPPCDFPILLNGELPPRSCTSMSISSHSSMVSTPVLPSWSPGTPITPTRQPRRQASKRGAKGKPVGLGIQILYEGDRSRQFDGLGLVPSRMTEPDAAEEEDLGVPSRILLEEIYNTFTSPEALAAAAPFPVEKDLTDDETGFGDVFTARNIAMQGPSAVSTPRKNRSRSRQSYGLPTAASLRRARRMCTAETEDGDESRSSDSSGGSSQKPAWKY